MGYPTVGNTTSGETGNVVSMAVPLPTASSGDLLVMFVSVDGSHTFSSVTGWTELAQGSNSGPSTLGVWYKTATGSDTDPTVSWGGKEQGVYAVVVYNSGTYTGTPEISSSATGDSVNPDSGSLSPSWGTNYDTRFMSIVGTDGITNVSNTPTNYSVALDISTSSGQGASFSSTYRNLNATSEDPGQYVIDAAEGWIAYTMAIAGTAPAAGPTIYCNIGGVWKTAEVYVNIGGTWKTVTDIQVNIDGTWKAST